MYRPDAFFPLLQGVTAILGRLGIRYHLTGGLVSVFYAEPRLTLDADLVVDGPRLQGRLEEFLAAVQQCDYLVDPDAVRDAVQRGRMFQVIDTQECLKIDFYSRELIPGELDRSVWIDATPGLRLPFVSRPDLIAAKLVWISKGSHKSRRDVRQLLRSATEDEARTAREFAAKLKLMPLLDAVLAEPDEIDA